jgi:hypothetical protein
MTSEAEDMRTIHGSRDRFIHEHDTAFDFDAGWAAIVAQAEATPVTHRPPPTTTRRTDDERTLRPVPAVVDPQRRVGRRRVLVGAGTVAAAALAVVAIGVTGDAGDGGGDDRELATRIVTATRSALADAVEHEVTDWDRGDLAVDDEAWRDQTTAAVRFRHYALDGSGVSSDVGPLDAPTPSDQGPTAGPHPQLFVDHCFGEYAIQDLPIPAGATDISSSQAEALADTLADGSAVTDGTEVVDGREYIRVVDADGSHSAVYYVDPDTHRPELIVDAEEGYRTTIEYLPRTPELLAAFTPAIPDGLPQVEPLTRTDDHRPCS